MAILSINLVIQYDSKYYHSIRAKQDTNNSSQILGAGYNLIRLRDERILDIPGTLRIRETPVFSFESMATLIKKILVMFTLPPVMRADLEAYICGGAFVCDTDYLSMLGTLPRPAPGTSLAERNFALMAEWDSDLNGSLTPDLVTYASGEKVHWICPARGHKYRALIFNRTRGAGCPFCAGIGGSFVEPVDSLAAKNPGLAGEWHPSRNGKLRAEQFLPLSNKHAWWICNKSPTHEWEAVISSRTNGRGCPYCSRVTFHPDYSLASEEPLFAAEWHPTKNSDVTPHTISSRSKKKFWWVCQENSSHIWEASIYTRYLNRSGCPTCRRKK